MKVLLQILITTVLLTTSSAFAQIPIGSSFSFRGTLNELGAPANGLYDFEFEIWNDAVAGVEAQPALTMNDVSVSNGTFLVELDYGPDVFDGYAYWLGIQVNGTLLTPRQMITPAPAAIQTRGLFVDADEHVGVGTTSPVYPLHIENDSSASFENGFLSELTHASPDSSSAVIGLHQGTNANGIGVWGAHAGGGIGVSGFSGSGRAVSASVNETGAYAGYFTGGRTYFGGDVGLDLMDMPSFPLHISSEGDAALNVFNTGANGWGDGIVVEAQDVSGAAVHALASAAGSGFAVFGAVTDPAAFASYLAGGRTYFSGNVGIGTTDPQEALEVCDGNIRISSSADGKTTSFKSGPNGGAGSVEVTGTNGNLNVLFSNDSSSLDHGRIDVCDATGTPRVSMWVQFDPFDDSISIISGDSLEALVKNFRVPNPEDPTTDIVYACVEGPEAGMYERGTAQLVDGYARIELPRHFAVLAAQNGMTVHLTPRSIGSFGLAAVHKSPEYIEVRELIGGDGSYEFDWEVKAVRSYYEDYKVIRPWRRELFGDELTDDEAWLERMRQIESREREAGKRQRAHSTMAYVDVGMPHLRSGPTATE